MLIPIYNRSKLQSLIKRIWLKPKWRKVFLPASLILKYNIPEGEFGDYYSVGGGGAFMRVTVYRKNGPGTEDLWLNMVYIKLLNGSRQPLPGEDAIVVDSTRPVVTGDLEKYVTELYFRNKDLPNDRIACTVFQLESYLTSHEYLYRNMCRDWTNRQSNALVKIETIQLKRGFVIDLFATPNLDEVKIQFRRPNRSLVGSDINREFIHTFDKQLFRRKHSDCTIEVNGSFKLTAFKCDHGNVIVDRNADIKVYRNGHTEAINFDVTDSTVQLFTVVTCTLTDSFSIAKSKPLISSTEQWKCTSALLCFSKRNPQ